MVVQPGPGVAPALAIPRAEREEILRFVEVYELPRIVPGLAARLLSIDFENPSYGDVVEWQMVLRIVHLYRQHHKEFPFVVAPQDIVGRGKYFLGFQVANKKPVLVSWEQLSMHWLTLGSTGSGKTTWQHMVQWQLLLAGNIGQFILDMKSDCDYFLRHSDVLLLHRHAPLCLLKPPKAVPFHEFFNNFVTIFCRALYGGEHTKSVLYEALQKVYSRFDSPSLKDLKVEVDRLYKKTDTYSRRDAVQGVSHRLAKFELYPGLYEARHGVTYDEVFKHSLLIPVSILQESVEFLYSLILMTYFTDCRARRSRDVPNKVFAFDESLLSFGKDAERSHIQAGALVHELLSMARESGIILGLASSSMLALDNLVLSNTNIKVAMVQSSDAEAAAVARTFGLTPPQAEFLRYKLKRGQALLMLPGEHRKTMLIEYPPLLPGIKNITLAEYEDAKRRWDPLIPPLPPGLPGVVGDAPQDEPVAKKAHASRGPKVKLSDGEDALLRVLCEEGPRAGTEACRKARLPAQAGTAAKKRLVLYQYVREEKVIVRSGRGGLGLVLFPEELGFDALGLKASHGCRGHASPAHNYYCWELHRLLKDSQIEFLVQGKKSVDLFFVYRKEAHAGFLAALQGCGAQGINASRLEGGTSAVALEVEVSSGASAKTNVEKDKAVGVALVVEAVMPELYDSVSQELAGMEGVVAVDVLKLLDLLREARD